MTKPYRIGRKLLATLRAFAERFRLALRTDRYRPEQHYMRGPGPKTREKLERRGGAKA